MKSKDVLRILIDAAEQTPPSARVTAAVAKARRSLRGQQPSVADYQMMLSNAGRALDCIAEGFAWAGEMRAKGVPVEKVASVVLEQTGRPPPCSWPRGEPSLAIMTLTLEQIKHAATNPDVAKARRISARIKPSRKWEMMKLTGAVHPDSNALIYANALYSATLRRYSGGWPLGGGEWAVIGIWCEDGEPRHDWRDFQRIKNDLVGPEWEAVELFPAESRLLDPSNYYMLWCAPAIGIGKYEGRFLMGPEECLAPQRGWAGGKPR